MIARGAGRIVNISSVSGRIPAPDARRVSREQVRARGAVGRAAHGGRAVRRPGRDRRAGDDPHRVRVARDVRGRRARARRQPLRARSTRAPRSSRRASIGMAGGTGAGRRARSAAPIARRPRARYVAPRRFALADRARSACCRRAGSTPRCAGCSASRAPAFCSRRLRDAVPSSDMSSIDDAKRTAARAALAELPEHGIIGLGTGSTTRFFIDAVGEAVATGAQVQRRADLGGEPQTGNRARHPAATRRRPVGHRRVRRRRRRGRRAPRPDQGRRRRAHAREDRQSTARRKNVIIVDASKLSKRLGEKWPVPIEVLPFAHLATKSAPREARRADPAPQGRQAVDHRRRQPHLRRALRPDRRTPARSTSRSARIPGVVETGLFVGRADIVLVAAEDGVKKLVRA